MVVFACIVIFLFSSQPGIQSSKISNDFFIRKLGHFSEYAVLGFFLFAYLTNIFIRDKKGLKNTALASLFVSSLYAISDELHQLFVEGRDGNIKDILIDSSGALFGIIVSGILFFLIFLKKR